MASNSPRRWRNSQKRFWAAQAMCVAAMTVAAGVYAVPATAQFFPFDDRFFNPRPQQPARPAPVQEDFSRAPAAKAPEAAPTIRILVLGDSMADWLAFGLEEQLAETPEIGIVRKHRAFSGLIRYEQRSDAEWPKVARDLIAQEKPQAIVMLVGLQDRQAIREKVQAPAKPAAPQKSGTPGAAQPSQSAQQPNGQQKAAEADDDETPQIAANEQQRARPSGPFEFRSEKWEEAYGARVDEMIAVLKTANVPVLWVGVPAVRGTKSTSDLQYLNEVVRPHVEKAGLIYVDVWDGFVDERNSYMQRGPDVDGQIRQLRTSDGVHFTRFGARKLAHYVERDLRRVLREPIPAALNVPSEPVPMAQPAKPAGPAARPLAGPVILLGTPLKEPDDLLGGSAAKSAALDPQASRMLVKGEPARAEAGRADDFSWPPRMPNLVASEPLPPTGAPLAIVRATPPAPPPQAVAAKPGAPAHGTRVAGQPVLQGQTRPQTQQQPAPFWRRMAPDSGPRFFFGLFGGR